jgi:4a-hydroxytetrahydrobiopterin dehydratase
MTAPLLSPEELSDRLTHLDRWTQEGQSITRSFSFDNFAESMKFVAAVAAIAEAAEHHPEILIQYEKVRISLSTHNVGGVTEKDVEVASAIERI